MKTDRKPEGIFENGDLWFGEREEEDGRTWYFAYAPENLDDPDYQTEEIPDTFPLFVMARFNDGTSEKEVNDCFHSDFNTQYAMARNIGEKRFGNECKHGRATRGYCPDCLRKVR